MFRPPSTPIFPYLRPSPPIVSPTIREVSQSPTSFGFQITSRMTPNCLSFCHAVIFAWDALYNVYSNWPCDVQHYIVFVSNLFILNISYKVLFEFSLSVFVCLGRHTAVLISTVYRTAGIKPLSTRSHPIAFSAYTNVLLF